MEVALVSPERILYEGEADMVIARSAGGDIAFLNNHAPFVGVLGIGKVRIMPAATSGSGNSGDELVAAEVDGLRRALGEPARERIPPHLTLVPPVNVREEHVEDAIAVLRRAAALTRPFSLTLGPPATFLPENPVAYLAVSGDLDALHALRDAVFTPPLERKLTWPFVPHVTLADGIDPPRVERSIDVLADYRRDVAIECVHLLEEGDGHAWKPIADVPFAAVGIVGRGGIELELTVSERLDTPTRAWLEGQWPDRRRPLAVTGRREGVVVGIASGWTDGDLANLSELFVDRGARREGVGSHLVAAFVSAVIERGATRCRVRTDDAEPFYAALGWRVEARYAGHADGAEIVQMVRDL